MQVSTQDYDDWLCLEDKYKVIKELGQGTYGTVYLAERRIDGEKVAIKHLREVFKHDYMTRKVLREINLLMQLS